jgi:hypothetical protein
MLYNEKIKGESYAKEINSGFGTLQWLKINSADTHSASRNNAPPPSFRSPQLSINETVRVQQEDEGEESNLAQKTSIRPPPL